MLTLKGRINHYNEGNSSWRAMKFLLALIFLQYLCCSAYAQGMVTIPLENTRLASDDLEFEGRILRSDEAHLLGMKGLDLSKLNPAASALWNNEKQNLSDQADSIDIQENETLQFGGALLSASGLFRFNATVGNITAIIHLDKTIHTMLLRKNILRLMGYKVPAIKWFKRLTINFNSQEEMTDFLDSQIPRATLGAASRWVESKDITLLSVVLHDIAVTIPSFDDHYNLAQGTPPQILNSRTLRALILPYALADLGESVNKFEWIVGRISDNEILLPHFTRGIFPTSMDDAKWALNQLKNISLDDFHKAVELSHFPPEVAKLVTEKILSRRNSLFRLFSVKTPELAVKLDITQLPYLMNGKIIKEDWKGFASRFAHGDPESPFKDFHWYALTKLQSILFDNLMERANKELSVFDPKEERNKFIMDQFNEGLDHFVKTGEFLSFPVRTWFSPLADLNLSASRDVVLGNYLGTDNLVQVADTLGWSVRLGGQLGVENIYIAPTLAVTGTLGISKSWSHIKPIRNLKDALKEPYRNMAVPLLKWQINKDLKRLKDLASSKDPNSDWDLKKDDSELSQIITHLNKNLGVGESLLYTENLAPFLGAQAIFNNMVLPLNVRLAASANVTLIRRVQIYRRDANTIQVYDDYGHGKGWTFDVTLEKFIPIIRLGWRGQNGKYSIRLHEVVIDPSIKDNPKLFDNAHALSQFLQTGSSELLEAGEKPNIVESHYKDKTARLGILAWRYKKLKTQTHFEIKSRDGLEGRYVSYTDEKQTGWNWEAFSKDFINYGIKQLVPAVEWGGNPFQNPAETLAGMGTTTGVRFEASLDEAGKHEERFMRLSDNWEGWSAKVKTVQKKMLGINKKFGFSVFDSASIENAKKLQLFKVSVNLNLYENGIKKLSSISEDHLIEIEQLYEAKSALGNCSIKDKKLRMLSNGKSYRACGILSTLLYQNSKCKKKLQGDEGQEIGTKCLVTLFRHIYEKLNYTEIANLIGRDNIFVHGSVNGFRNGEEVLNDPILSNTDGTVGGNFWDGPFDIIQRMLGINGGEFHGYWLRDRL